MTVYRSRIDGWLFAVLLVAACLSGGAGLAAVTAGASMSALIAPAIGVLLPAWLMRSTRYTLGERELVVRSGPFRWRIPVAEITRIERTSNPLSSPALSLRRLRIEYGNGRSLMISPRDEADFLAELDRVRALASQGSRTD